MLKLALAGVLSTGILLAGCAPQLSGGQAIPLEAYVSSDGSTWYYNAPAGQVKSLDTNTDLSSFTSVQSATNSWGPFEINTSNGGRAPRDGRPLSLSGTVFASGIGMHANAELTYSTPQTPGLTCRFTALAGVDDEVRPDGDGDVVVQVIAGGVKLFESPVLHASATAPQAIDVTFQTPQVLSIRVNRVGDYNYFDHADLVNPKLSCTPTQG